MTLESGELYQKVILAHNREPQNFAKREAASHCIEAYNPVCGDQYKLYFDIEGGKVSNLSFHGYGCAISKASVSIMTEMLEGMPVSEALKIYREFISAIQGSSDHHFREGLEAFAPVKKHPGRIKCVTLGWDALNESIQDL